MRHIWSRNKGCQVPTALISLTDNEPSTASNQNPVSKRPKRKNSNIIENEQEKKKNLKNKINLKSV